MCGPGLGIQLLFIPEEFEGMGGGAFDVYRVCEELARVDLGVATGVLATFLGSDPIIFGGTYEQKKLWMTRIGQEGLLMAYGATEPEAGSDLAALRTVADPVMQDGKVTGYKITGNKQWISNGGYADLYSVLAKAPGGPSWFIVEKDAPGLSHGKPEDKHGIRASNTATVSLEGVYVDADRLLGGVGRTGTDPGAAGVRLHAPDGCRVRAWARAGRLSIARSRTRWGASRAERRFPKSRDTPTSSSFRMPYCWKPSRSYIEETAERIDSEEGNLNTEGAIAKYLATEAGNLAADASIQALGGYGYTREYMVEKIKRDARITTNL